MKKNLFAVVLFVTSLFVSGFAQARDTRLLLPIQEALQMPLVEERLTGDIQYFFGDQSYPPVKKKLGTFAVNKKTNAVGKTDEEACNYVFLSAMLQLQQRAIALGANAVVNIVSYYKKVPYSSSDKFECHAGSIMAGVALKGDFVTIAE